MPNRGIKESILTSKTIDRLSPLAERFFYRLLLVCDDYGRTEADPSVLRSRCFPRQVDRVSNEDVEGWLQELVNAPLIVRYTVGDRDYLQFIKWDEHQRRGRKAKRSKYPAPPQDVLPGSADPVCHAQEYATGSADPARASAEIREDPPVTSETSETSETGDTPLPPISLDNLAQTDHTETPDLVRRYFSRNRPSRYRRKDKLAEWVQACAACFDEALDDFTADELAEAIDASPRRMWWWEIVDGLRKAPPARAAPQRYNDGGPLP